MKKRTLAIAASLLTMATTTQAGGLLTNTNQHIAFNRSFARIGAIGIDGVYFNPAGVAFMDKGFHVSLNIQNVYQTREMNSSVTVPSLQGTPFYQPFKLNGGNEEGYKYYKGKASVPILPSFQAALNYDKWGFQLGFGLTGGGGKATFNDGLPSFERQIAMIPALLYAQGLGSTTPSYSLSSYMNGQQYDFGLQIGATYKFSDHLAAYAGARFNYIYNKYEGNIVNVSANIGGTNQNLYNYFDAQATALTQKAAAFLAQANAATDLPSRHS